MSQMINFVIFLVCATVSAAADDTTSEQTSESTSLREEIRQAGEGSAEERMRAFGRIRLRWTGTVLARGGFSDLPVPREVVKQPEKMTDDQLELIAKALIEGLQDDSKDLRNAAALCLSRAPRRTEGIDRGIDIGLRSEHHEVYWNVCQVRPELLPDPKPYVAMLIGRLTDESIDESVKLGLWVEFDTLLTGWRERFKPHVETVIRSLDDIPEKCRPLVLSSLNKAGFNPEAAEQLYKKARGFEPELKTSAFLSLFSHPDFATDLLSSSPEIQGLVSERANAWYVIFLETDSRYNAVKNELLKLPNFPPLAAAFIGAEKYRPQIEAKLETANSYRKHFLNACLRACGGEIDRHITINSESDGRFKPDSAWPGSDKRRQPERMGAHGDGVTYILITGEVRGSGKRHPKSVRFVRRNDSMLMGQAIEADIPRKYDPQTGRFLLQTHIFAAYSFRPGPEPGPYQTGSALIRVEAPGYKPLDVRFFDEMPHVVIELERQPDSE
ncbi:hypothetical protein [Stratiformator vulcanicus]|uniref:Uncharacterized protein n=1 Tax=Stratiformator vulcanicus TaxID=2527980 RepID=A0A517R054_9PLAN|nr:hypothetical protein [Stratiformator vulcanicus]QDT37248.1 hypothetical protein Pan189_16210 [Stratiformator vulcanicus]